MAAAASASAAGAAASRSTKQITLPSMLDQAEALLAEVIAPVEVASVVTAMSNANAALILAANVAHATSPARGEDKKRAQELIEAASARLTELGRCQEEMDIVLSAAQERSGEADGERQHEGGDHDSQGRHGLPGVHNAVDQRRERKEKRKKEAEIEGNLGDDDVNEFIEYIVGFIERFFASDGDELDPRSTPPIVMVLTVENWMIKGAYMGQTDKNIASLPKVVADYNDLKRFGFMGHPGFADLNTGVPRTGAALTERGKEIVDMLEETGRVSRDQLESLIANPWVVVPSGTASGETFIQVTDSEGGRILGHAVSIGMQKRILQAILSFPRMTRFVPHIPHTKHMRNTTKDLVGLQREAEDLRSNIEFPILYPGVSDKPRGILLSGMPGVGKTFIIGCATTDANEEVVRAVGTKTRFRQMAFSGTFAGPTLVFLDEVDSMLEGSASIRGAMLKSLDEMNTTMKMSFEVPSKRLFEPLHNLASQVFGSKEVGDYEHVAPRGLAPLPVGATNYPRKLDGAIKRRLGITVSLPSLTLVEATQMAFSSILDRLAFVNSGMEAIGEAKIGFESVTANPTYYAQRLPGLLNILKGRKQRIRNMLNSGDPRVPETGQAFESPVKFNEVAAREDPGTAESSRPDISDALAATIVNHSLQHALAQHGTDLPTVLASKGEATNRLLVGDPAMLESLVQESMGRLPERVLHTLLQNASASLKRGEVTEGNATNWKQKFEGGTGAGGAEGTSTPSNLVDEIVWGLFIQTQGRTMTYLSDEAAASAYDIVIGSEKGAVQQGFITRPTDRTRLSNTDVQNYVEAIFNTVARDVLRFQNSTSVLRRSDTGTLVVTKIEGNKSQSEIASARRALGIDDSAAPASAAPGAAAAGASASASASESGGAAARSSDDNTVLFQARTGELQPSTINDLSFNQRTYVTAPIIPKGICGVAFDVPLVAWTPNIARDLDAHV
jgi:hypothetical protein